MTNFPKIRLRWDEVGHVCGAKWEPKISTPQNLLPAPPHATGSTEKFRTRTRPTDTHHPSRPPHRLTNHRKQAPKKPQTALRQSGALVAAEAGLVITEAATEIIFHPAGDAVMCGRGNSGASFFTTNAYPWAFKHPHCCAKHQQKSHDADGDKP